MEALVSRSLQDLAAPKTDGDLVATDDIFESVVKGDLESTCAILNIRPDDVAVKELSPAPYRSSYKTPLHYAATFGHHAIAKALMEHGAEPDARDDEGRTPLHWAAYSCDLRMLRLLIAWGADVNARNCDGTSALDNYLWILRANPDAHEIAAAAELLRKKGAK